MVTLLISADELCIGHHMTLHSSLDLRFRRPSQIERDIQRVELMEEPVPTYWWVWAPILRLLKIIEAYEVPCGDRALPTFSGKLLALAGMP